MANVTNKIFVDKMGGRSTAQYVGTQGEIFYDPAVGELRLSDGTSPGGKAISGEQNSGMYRGYQAGVNFFRGTGDGDIAQVIIHNAGGRVDYINYTENSNDDNFYATNLLQNDQQGEGDTANTIIMLNLYGSNTSGSASDTAMLTISEIRTFVRKFIDLVMYDDQDNQVEDLQAAKEAFYANITPLTQALPDGTLFPNFAFDDWRRIHWPEYNTPAGVTHYADILVHFNNLDDTELPFYIDCANIVMGQAGSGWEIGDTVTLTGDQLGGVTGTNDLVLTVTALKDGGVTALQLIDGGADFYPHDGVSNWSELIGGSGEGCAILIETCTATGAIVNFQIRNGGGSGYEVGDTLTINYNGTDATFEVVTVGTNGIADLTFPEDAIAQRAPIGGNGYFPRMHIGDGLDDQYDDGNWISTDASTAILTVDMNNYRMTIVDSTQAPSEGLREGMICVIRNNDYSYHTFRLVAQSTDNQSVWFVDTNNSYEGATVRIDGIPYNNGNVTTGDYFSTGGYVTVYQEGIFAMIAMGANVNSVYYNGEMGADGSGYKEVNTLLGARAADYTVKSVPQNLVGNGNYAIQTSDAGKHIYYNDGGSNNVYLRSDYSKAMPVGTAVTIVSGQDGNTYISPDDGTVQIWGAGFNQTSNYWFIPPNSIATLLKIGDDKWMLSGAGLGID